MGKLNRFKKIASDTPMQEKSKEEEKQELFHLINSKFPKEYLAWLESLNKLSESTSRNPQDYSTITNPEGAFYATPE